MTTPALTTFRDRLADMFRIKRWNQTRLAKETGISIVSISRYLSGERNPTLINAILIADALGVSLDWLCGREDSL